MIEVLRKILVSRTRSVVSEDELQSWFADELATRAIAFEREVQLTPKDRIDFLFAEGLGVEMKVDGSLSEVTRQVHRYAQSERIARLVVATTRSRHRALPASMNGKPVDVLHLIGCSL